jgi:hypothetical protein
MVPTFVRVDIEPALNAAELVDARFKLNGCMAPIIVLNVEAALGPRQN